MFHAKLPAIIKCGVAGICLQIISSRTPWITAFMTACCFVLCGIVLDKKYQDGCEDGTQIWFGDILPALFQGRLFEELRRVNQERRRQKETKDGLSERKEDD